MQKRVTLTTLNPANGGMEAEDRNGLPSMSKKTGEKGKKQETEPPVRTIRLKVQLQRPTKDHYSELHYDELVRKQAEVSGCKAGDATHKFPDATDEEDEDVVRLARSFDQKYGRNKRHCGWDDYVDKGMGYDETDPFIDNDEAYDELIPSSLTTKYGGFYVNTGPLDFKPVPASQLPDEPRPPVVKRRKSVNGSTSGQNVNKKKKKDSNQPEGRTVAQMIDNQKKQNQNRDTHSPEEQFLQPQRKGRPVIVDDDDDMEVDKDAAGSDAPRSQSIDDVIECVARGRANGTSKTQHPQPQSSASHEKQSVIRMAGDGRETKMEGLAMSSLARMVSITGRTDGEQSRQNTAHQQRSHRPTDLSQNSSRPQDSGQSPAPQGFRQHPGLVDTQPKSSASSSLLSRTPAASLIQGPFNTSKNSPSLFDRSNTPHRTQQQSSTSDHQKQSPGSAQIRSTFQSVIKTSIDAKKGTESATIDSLMEKVISNSLQQFPNSGSSPFGMQSPSSSMQMQGKNFKTPPAAHQQPKNAFAPSFRDPASILSRGNMMDAMISEHLANDQKSTGVMKMKSELPQGPTSDSLPHAKIIKYKDQYRIPNLPAIGPKDGRHHSSASSSNRPNSLPSLTSSKHHQQPQQQLLSPQQQQLQSQSRAQKTSPPAVSPVPSTSSQGQKGSQSKNSHSNRSSPSHVRQSPHTPDSLNHHSFSPVVPQTLWNPMAMFNMYESQFLSSRSPPTSMSAGLSVPLSRPLIPGTQGVSNLPPNQFLNMHSYAAPPSGGTKEGNG